MSQTLNSFKRIFLQRFRVLALLPLLLITLPIKSNDLNLPDLGDSLAGIATPLQEYRFGQQWLRYFRSQTNVSQDPFINQYVERMTKELLKYSDVQDRRISTVVVNNPTLNAFAVPGGVIGVHTGLFRYSGDEQQLASVLAHELAHLSQRHHARKLEEQKQNSLLTMAGLFASILIAASSSGDQGIAALSATQALSIDAALRFSRSMEQEADRIGIETLVRAGLDPHAMPDMFEQMLRASQYSRRPPEFLLTHPITESRVIDSKNRARRYPEKPRSPELEFELIKMRITIEHSQNKLNLVNVFKNKISGTRFSDTAAQYGLTLAYIETNQPKLAVKEAQSLLKTHPNNPFFIAALTRAYQQDKAFIKAEQTILPLLKIEPDNHALNVTLAELYMAAGEHEKCANLLIRHSQRRPKDAYVWYLLAEIEGLRGNILGVHLARAEYFYLNGIYRKSRLQIESALKTIKTDDPLTQAKVEQRLKQVRREERNPLS